MAELGPRAVDIAGLTFLLTGSTEAAQYDLAAALGADRAAEHGFDMELRCEPGGVILPPREPERIVQHLSYWSESDAKIVAVGQFQRARVWQNSAVLDPGIDSGALGVHALLLPVLALLFAQRGLCLVHAGALLDQGGAVLVLGPSGQGKSTLIAAALGSGQVVLGDDLMVARLDSGSVSICGVPQPLSLPADLEHEAAVGLEIDGDPRSRRAPAGAVDLNTDWHPLGSVVLVEHSELSEGHLRPATGRETFHRLLTSTLDGLSDRTSRHAFPFAAAVARVPAWHLGHTREPRNRVTEAVRKLKQIRDAPTPAG